MPKAKRLPSGNYRTQVYAGKDENGKPRYESFTAPTARESELLAAQFKADLNRKKQTDRTVGEAIDGYISAKEAVLSPSTIKAYKSQAKIRYDSIRNKSIRKLTSEDLQLFVSSLVGKVSPKTIANVYGLLSSALTLYAPDRVFRVTLPKKAKKKQTAPSDEEVQLLYNEAQGEMKVCIALAAFGSCRRGEICALKYKDVSEKGVYVHCDLVQDYNKNWILKEMPKNNESVRSVLLPEQVLDLIGSGDPEEFIIKKTPDAVSSSFGNLRDRLGLEHIRFHDLRHYFASIAAVLDIPQTYIADFGGWRQDSPVLKEVYQNKIIPIADRYAGKLAGHFSGLIDSKEDTDNTVKATAKKLPSGNYRTQLYIGKDENGRGVYKSFTAPTPEQSLEMAVEYKKNMRTSV